MSAPPPPEEKESKAPYIAVGIFVLILVAIAGNGEDPNDECETAYRNDYVFYGEPEAMSLEDYCENFNDTSWLDEDAYNIGETYE